MLSDAVSLRVPSSAHPTIIKPSTIMTVVDMTNKAFFNGIIVRLRLSFAIEQPWLPAMDLTHPPLKP